MARIRVCSACRQPVAACVCGEDPDPAPDDDEGTPA
jgi:hypothetical protein